MTPRTGIPLLALAAGAAVFAVVRRRRPSPVDPYPVKAYPVAPVVQHPAPGGGVTDLSTLDEPAGVEPPTDT